MQIEGDALRAAPTAEVLLEACAWARATFFGDEGPSEPNVLAEGFPGRTLHIANDAEQTCKVWLPLANPAAATGLPDIAAHEGFHVSAGANVYHWTHEAFACLNAHLSHFRQVNGGSTELARRQLGELLMGQARLFSQFCTPRTFRLETVPHQAPERMQAFYSRARVVGLDLLEVTGLELLASLAQAVRDARCEEHPHVAHEDCPMDRAFESWLADLATGARSRIRLVLELE